MASYNQFLGRWQKSGVCPFSTHSGRYLTGSLVSPVSEAWLTIQASEPRGRLVADAEGAHGATGDGSGLFQRHQLSRGLFFSGPKPVSRQLPPAAPWQTVR